jgi:zinc transport system ATP-binding protein
MSVTPPTLTVENLSFTYTQDEVLTGVSFTIPEGTYVGLVGPNGAGKSTLLKLILGLLTPSTGSITLKGVSQSHFNEWSTIGYVPQKATNFDALFPATVYDVVAMGRYGMRGIGRLTREDHARIEEAIARVGMEQYRDRLIGDLSGGQQQRVFIARALAGEPKILILDEPTVGVEQQRVDAFYALLKSLNQEGMTLIVVTHDVQKMVEEASHILFINKKVVCFDTPEVFVRDQHISQPLPGDIHYEPRFNHDAA